MTTYAFRTNLRCSACVESIRPHLDAVPTIARWHVDLESPDKVLFAESQHDPKSEVAAALAQAGYSVLGEISAAPAAPIANEPKPSYFPQILIVSYLLLATAAVEWSFGSFHWMRAMRHFMAGFFLTFSFFKLLDLRGFATSYGMYDLVAARWPAYAWVYPFLELTLGLAYLANVVPFATNLATVILMTVGTAGVVHSMLQKRKVRCACLGTIINLPVASVTLLEDAGMAVMAAVMLVVTYFNI
jgi:hypothetical protein